MFKLIQRLNDSTKPKAKPRKRVTADIVLCEKFPSLNPISIRQTRAKEMFKLIQRLNDSTKPKAKPRKRVTADNSYW